MLISSQRVVSHSQSTPNPVSAPLLKCWPTESQMVQRISFFSQCSPNTCLKSRVIHQIKTSIAKDSAQVQNLKTSKHSDFSVSDQQILNCPSNYFSLWSPLQWSPLLLLMTSVSLSSATNFCKKSDFNFSTKEMLNSPSYPSSVKPDLTLSSTSHFQGTRQNYLFPMWHWSEEKSKEHLSEALTERDPSDLPDNPHWVCLPWQSRHALKQAKGAHCHSHGTALCHLLPACSQGWREIRWLFAKTIWIFSAHFTVNKNVDKNTRRLLQPLVLEPAKNEGKKNPKHQLRAPWAGYESRWA